MALNRYIYKILLFVIVSITVFACAKSDESRPDYNGESNSYTDGSDGSDSNTGKSGSLARFTVVGDNLYTVTERGLKYFDVSNDEKPVFKKHIELGFGAETIFSYDDKLFIGTSSGIQIFDISNPQAPNKISYFLHINSCDPVVANDKFAYATIRADNNCNWGQNRLEIIDISDIYNPYEVTTVDMETPYGLALYSNNLFVCDKGLKLFSLDTISGYPTLIKTFDIDAYDLIADKNHLYVMGKGSIKQYKFSNNNLDILSEINAEE